MLLSTNFYQKELIVFRLIHDSVKYETFSIKIQDISSFHTYTVLTVPTSYLWRLNLLTTPICQHQLNSKQLNQLTPGRVYCPK